jgi:hypothetical protein
VDLALVIDDSSSTGRRLAMVDGHGDLLRTWMAAYVRLRGASDLSHREVVLLTDRRPTADARLHLLQRAALALDVPTTIVWPIAR